MFKSKLGARLSASLSKQNYSQLRKFFFKWKQLEANWMALGIERKTCAKEKCLLICELNFVRSIRISFAWLGSDGH